MSIQRRRAGRVAPIPSARADALADRSCIRRNVPPPTRFAYALDAHPSSSRRRRTGAASAPHGGVAEVTWIGAGSYPASALPPSKARVFPACAVVGCRRRRTSSLHVFRRFQRLSCLGRSTASTPRHFVSTSCGNHALRSSSASFSVYAGRDADAAARDLPRRRADAAAFVADPCRPRFSRAWSERCVRLSRCGRADFSATHFHPSLPTVTFLAHAGGRYHARRCEARQRRARCRRSGQHGLLP